MRTIDIAGVEYKIRNKYEITHKACRRVELLIPSLFFNSFDMEKLIEDSKNKEAKGKKKDIEREIFVQLLKNPEKFVEFIQMMTSNIDNSYKDIIAIMLVTDKDYAEVNEMPQMTLIELAKEAKKEIGSYEDFTSGLGINIESSLDSVIGVMTKIQKNEV
jgi:hypothetical protein